MNNVLLVAGREVRQAIRRRSFWIVVVQLFVGASAAMIVPELVGHKKTHVRVAIVDAPRGFEEALRSTANSIDVDVAIVPALNFAAARRAVEADHADVAAVAGVDPTVVVKSGGDQLAVGLVQQALAISVLATRLEDAGLPAEGCGSPGVTMRRGG